MYSGKLITLRPFERPDAVRYRAWVNDAEIAALIDRIRPVTEAEHATWYEQLVSSPNSLVFAVDRNRPRRFIGLVWLFDVHWRHRRAEVRIVLGDRASWSGGYGSEALRRLARIAFQGLALDKLWAEVLTTNPRAARAFERAGFVREGLLRADRVAGGRRVDVVRLGLVRGH